MVRGKKHTPEQFTLTEFQTCLLAQPFSLQSCGGSYISLLITGIRFYLAFSSKNISVTY